MKESPSALIKWLDRDFYKLGAFLTSYDGKEVVFAKGGSFTIVEEFLEIPSPIFYLKDFYHNRYLAYSPAETIKVSRDEITLPEEEPQHFSPLSNDDDLYQKDFGLLESAFGSDLQKVVLISRETYEPFEEEKTIIHLMKKAFSLGSGIPYGFWNSQYGVIGSTPELLFDVQNEVLNTYALAGTAKSGQEQNLLESAKDRHEHNLVIQDIQEKLANFSSQIETSPTHIHSFKSIIHLRTDIEAKVSPDTNYTALTNTLSPTAALGGYPKLESLNFLRGSHYGRKYSERYFGSALGLMSQETKEFIVSIRNVQWEGHHLFIESGGGVVSESVFEKELDEIHLKRNTIRKHYL